MWDLSIVKNSNPFKTKLKYAALLDADFLLTWDLNLDLILKAVLKARSKCSMES